MSVAAGTRLGPYEVLGLIGAGGMGEVYKAHDTRLDRTVAIKVLPADISADPYRRACFEREAKTIAGLTHPHICTLHDVGEHDGALFLVMEHLEGETLAHRIEKGPLLIDQALEYAAQIADALAEAHEHHIIHRDLKPANVIVTAKGAVKVLDFGLAKLVKPSEAAAATTRLAESKPDLMMGTMPYMAPEQLLGKAVDARADIYALGATLYELATSQRPFREKQASALIAAIVTRSPQPPHELNGHISRGLEAIILKTLEKDPDDRYRSAKELLEDLGRVAAGPARHPGCRSLAVLPLQNLSMDPQQEYFADGMTDALITNLAKISALRVISRTTAMYYKGSRKTLPEVAKELNVDAIVEGSVLRSGNRVRISAQLIQAASDEHVWAESYERNMRDVLSLQSELARAIAREIRTSLTAQEQRRLASTRTVNPEAYDAYLAGRVHWYRHTRQELDTALGYFRLALERDPNDALALVGIGSVWGMRAHTGLVLPREGWPKAKEVALKVLELDDSLAEAHELLASTLAWHEWDWAAGEREYRRAIELNPNCASARCFYSFFLHAMRRQQEATLQIERALELDPYNGFFHMVLGTQLLNLGRPDEALSELHRAKVLEPDNPFVRSNLSHAFARKGDYEQARSEAKKSFILLDHEDVAEALDRGYHHGGYLVGLRRAADVAARKERGSTLNSVEIALLYAEAGEIGRAVDWFEQAYRDRSTMLPYLNVWPLAGPVRREPRFQALVGRMSFPS
jgi:serine/threonine-protein kinase